MSDETIYFILKLIYENTNLQKRINKAIHLINHNDCIHYTVFEENLLKILEGEKNEKKN